jgi:hypothetical protein
MKRALSRLALIAAPAAVLLLGAGCIFGGGAMSLEDYFADLDKADQDVSDAFDAFQTIAEGQDVEEVKAAYQDLVDAIDGLISNMEDLDPPDEAKEQHDAALEALRGFRDEFAAAVDEAQGASSLAELGQAFASDDLNTASQTFTDACVELQGVADENEVDASLGCAGEEDDGGDATPTAE